MEPLTVHELHVAAYYIERLTYYEKGWSKATKNDCCRLADRLHEAALAHPDNQKQASG